MATVKVIMDMVGASAPAEGLGDSPGGKTDQQEATDQTKMQKGFIKKFAGITKKYSRWNRSGAR